MKFARLTERVAAGSGINYQKDFVRRGRILLGERAFNFLELGHEIRFCVQTAGRIAKQEINLVVRGFLVGVVTKRGRIRAVLALHHFNAESLRPNAQLLNRGRTKRVGRGQQNGMSVFVEQVR